MNNFNNKELQSKILEIVVYFDNFCKQNNIRYYLMGGTALGAVRHKGFIPWDDDFDVFLDFENYQKLQHVVKENLDRDKFYFQEENTDEWPMYFSKLRLNGTTYIEKDVLYKDMHHGIYIDIMCLNNVSPNYFVRYLQYLSARVLNAKALYSKGYITTSVIKKIAMRTLSYFVSRKTGSMLLNFVRSFNAKDTGMVGHLFGRARFKKTSFPASYLGDPIYTKFENLDLPIPQNAHGYLKLRYGDDYMKMPSEEVKMSYPSHAYIVDITKSYESYMDKK
ncbi:lipopolysaccharide cholinephosphotransferase [Candidatus Francisella endociliophora]|uniref:Lipopolysaccharide cholinephosphotransferase n=1 Tax=Candidatus Francisella endociliophora TaxID=653937 RepID=A0A097ER35_9GAMM|nr:LicD family protein [Francisella sp. FSC1006]AIT10014.1 lipopolysaccharide cholinephosphotransferase [Francisella sp. FSC1006]